MKKLPLLTSLLGIVTPLFAADTFIENFDGPTVSPKLEIPSVFRFGASSMPVGSAQNTVQTDSRSYIRTTATDYSDVDFTFEVTVTIRGSEPSEAAFVGIGTGIADPNYFTEPHTSIYFRLFPNGFLEGALGLTVSKDPQNHEEAIVSSPPHPGVGAHRVQLRKIGKRLIMSCDVNYQGGAFTPDYSLTRLIDSELSFLNSTNSRLFFGIQGTQTTFDNLSVQVLPRLTIEVAQVAVCWISVTNVTYQLQYRSEATANAWMPFGEPLLGNGSTNCVVDTVIGQPRRFYRVVEIETQ